MTLHLHARAIHRGRIYTGPYPSDGLLAFLVLMFLDVNPYDTHIPTLYALAARLLLPRRRMRYSR